MDIRETVLVVILLLNLSMLGTSRVHAAIRMSAFQGALLGILAVVCHADPGTDALVMGIATAIVKAVVIPVLLTRAMRDVAIRREIEPFIGYMPSMLLGGLGTGAAVMLVRTLPLAPGHVGSLLIPTALSTALTGFLLLVTRRKAITQVVGYLLLENGIFVMGMSLLDAMPFLVEVGLLLDLMVGIFVLGIIMDHINREFSSLDTARLTALRER